MKPFVRYTALILALLFLAGAGIAWFDLLQEGNLLANPKTKATTGLLVPGVMFLALALRGRHRRKPTGSGPGQNEITKLLR